MSRLRIVVADQAEAVFYELAPGVHLREVARFEDAAAHGHERDFSSDRPGRTHAPMGEGLRHSFGPEPHARRDAAVRFARAIARVLEEARLRDEWDDLVLFAGERFLGTLRRELPPLSAERVVQAVAKDLAHHPVAELERHVALALERIEAA